MVFKFVAFAALVAAANAGVITSPLAYSAHVATPIAYAAPIAKVATPVIAKAVVPEPYDPHPQYNYGYGVDDHLTGDSKSQVESRDGDVVHGSYSLTDADGFRRTVDYTADPINGFNAVVRREPLAIKAVAPVVAKVATPLAYSTPVVHHAVATPVVHHAVATPFVAKAAIAAPVAAYSTYAAPATIYHH